MAFYCGNNLHEMRGRPLGTPYECMRRGVGAGLHGDLSKFSPNYQPIFTNNIYCGKGDPPPGKVLGKPHQCLSKGYGIGLKLKYERGYHEPRISLRLIIMIFFVALAIFSNSSI